MLAAAWAFPLVAARIVLVLEQRVDAGLVDARGFLADLVVAAVLSTVVAPLFARWRWPVALLVPWCVFHYSSYEFTGTMNAVPPWQSIGYLGDATFVYFLGASSPVLGAIPASIYR